jgi:ParB family chromosome partitioning protein
MAERAQELLVGSGWLPELLRTPVRTIDATSLASESGQTSAIGAAGEESAATGCETAMADSDGPAEDVLVTADEQPVAAEYKGAKASLSKARRRRRAFFLSGTNHVDPSL